MARTKKSNKKNDETPKIIRNYDLMSLEKRLYDLDHSPQRSWDLYAMEKRIYDLEINGGGGGSTSKLKSGTFTTEATQYGISEIDLGFKPDFVMVFLPLNSKDTTSYWYNGTTWGSADAIWNTKPAENGNYVVTLGRVTGETGIQSITDNGFKFIVNGANTRGVLCKYIAGKIEE